MRVFTSMTEAARELKRDIFKGPSVRSTRVQNLEDREIEGSERFGYLYSVLDDFPGELDWSAGAEGSGYWTEDPVGRFVGWAQDMNFPLYVDYPEEMKEWLAEELRNRLHPSFYLGKPAPDHLNPALRKVVEGNHFSYTYRERLVGMRETFYRILSKNPDSRRAYWPIFRHGDALRAAEPTRIPCSVSYQAMIRQVRGEQRLLWFYQQRSMDYTNFWPSDLWFARQLQLRLVAEFQGQVVPGAVIHFVTSAHTFYSPGTEVY